MPPDNDFVDFVNKYLVVNAAKCYRHCQEPSKFVSLFTGDSSVVGAYICPSSYISRVGVFCKPAGSGLV